MMIDTIVMPHSHVEMVTLGNTYDLPKLPNTRFKSWLWDKVVKYFGLRVSSRTEREVTYNRVTIDTDDVLKVVYEHMMRIRKVFAVDVEMIIVGKDMIGHITRSTFDMNVTWGIRLPVQAQAGVVHDGERKPFSLYGAKLMYVPWATGITVVPVTRE